MKTTHLVLAAALIATALNTAQADNRKTTKARHEKTVAAQQQPQKEMTAADYVQQIAEMQKSIDELRFAIAKIQAERAELQAKIEQSDRDIAAHMKQIEAIKAKLAEKQKEAAALQAKKKR